METCRPIFFCLLPLLSPWVFVTLPASWMGKSQIWRVALKSLKNRLGLNIHAHQFCSHTGKRPWCWERFKAGGEGDDRGWDGWMTLLTRWTWVWASSGSWWWTGRLGVLQSMGHRESDTTERLNWNETSHWLSPTLSQIHSDARDFPSCVRAGSIQQVSWPRAAKEMLRWPESSWGKSCRSRTESAPPAPPGTAREQQVPALVALGSWQLSGEGGLLQLPLWQQNC